MREALGDHWGVAMTRFSNALLLEQEGDLEQARTEIEVSIELRETLGLDPHGLCNCYIQMGEVDRRLGRLEESARNLEKALEIAVRVRGPLAEGLAQEQLAHLDLARGRTADARTHALRAAAAYEAAFRIDDALRARRLVSESTSRRKSG
jgi:tetratricopeptide (TPR) repeat protein